LVHLNYYESTGASKALSDRSIHYIILISFYIMTCASSFMSFVYLVCVPDCSQFPQQRLAASQGSRLMLWSMCICRQDRSNIVHNFGVKRNYPWLPGVPHVDQYHTGSFRRLGIAQECILRSSQQQALISLPVKRSGTRRHSCTLLHSCQWKGGFPRQRRSSSVSHYILLVRHALRSKKRRVELAPSCSNRQHVTQTLMQLLKE